MITERLYYTDSYLSEFDASVVDATDDGRRVYLERTAFYPASGGQPHDLGGLGGQSVLEVIDEGDRIAHIIAAPLLSERVQGRIDWNRRYDHMQQHTGQHVLSAVFYELFQIQTLSFHMGSEASTIKVAAKVLADSQIEDAEQRANALVRESLTVNIRFEDAGSVQQLRKPSERTGELRVIEIEGLDRSGCGGTHVRSTAEVGPIQIRNSEKIRGNVRVEFVCGIRALLRAKQDFRILAELAKQGAVPVDGLQSYVTALRQRLLNAEKERQKLTMDLARREGYAMHDAAEPGSDGLRRIRLHVPAVDEAIRVRMQAFTERGHAVALVTGAEPPVVMVACSSDAGINAHAVVTGAAARAGGRGGGSATLAQASLRDSTVVDILAKDLGFSDSV